LITLFFIKIAIDLGLDSCYSYYIMPINEHQLRRLDKRQEMLEAGASPYPVAGGGFVTHSLDKVREIGEGFVPTADLHTNINVAICARVVFLRHSGGISFARLRAGNGTELQIMFSKGELGVDSFKAVKSTVDLGDFLRVEGEIIFSRTIELSVFAHSWQIASKALLPPPFEHGDLSDENRIRHRHLDLMQNQNARDMVRLRAAVLRSIRATLDNSDYLEVETPILQMTNGGATARPFTTHLNAFDQDMNLRIALELDLKRALIGGIDRVYSLAKCFRNEGVDSTHSPEFSMLESYEIFGNLTTQKILIQRLIENAAASANITTITSDAGEVINLNDGMGWRSADVMELVSEVVGTSVDLDTPIDTLRALASEFSVHLNTELDAGQIILELYETLVEHTLIQPTFVDNFPTSARPLARSRDDDPRYALASDLVILGMELGAMYTELNDPVLLRERLTQQSLQAAAGDTEAMDLDLSFIEAVESGMPPAGGLGLGVDRLIMLLAGTGIRETILFPLLRPIDD
jgi:lysyl-tRNA synthetase class 2